MYYHPDNNPELIRIERERRDNIQRLIAYNNKRVLLGLPLVNYPEALFKPVIDHENYPVHRDHIILTRR